MVVLLWAAGGASAAPAVSVFPIPGSHVAKDRFGETLQKDIFKCEENWGVAGRDVPAVALETTPGDVVIFNHNTKHASFGGSGWRRMFTLNLGQRCGPDRVKGEWFASFRPIPCRRCALNRSGTANP